MTKGSFITGMVTGMAVGKCEVTATSTDGYWYSCRQYNGYVQIKKGMQGKTASLFWKIYIKSTWQYGEKILK